MPLQVLIGPTIQAGESLSDGLDCTAGAIVRLTMPPKMTHGNLSFQISTDGQGYNDLFTQNGEEVTMACVPGTAVVLAGLGDALKAVAYLKIRTGTRDSPIAQVERIEFAVAVDTPTLPGQMHSPSAESSRSRK